MRAQFKNRVIYSTLLFLDNKICTRGEAYKNFGSKFYDVKDDYINYYTYGTPFRQFISDSSITGTTVMSGIYLNNSFITTGQSGFVGIDYNQGQVYFSNPVTGTLSGNYSVKDFNIILTNKPETTLLFETQYKLKPKTNQQITGLTSDQVPYPVIFVKNNGGTNEPLAFGGMDNTITNIRLLIMADSLFNLDAVCSIINDTRGLYIPLLSEQEVPFNVLGGFKSGSYNYNNLVSGKILAGQASFIHEVYVSNYRQNTYEEIRKLNPEVYVGIVELELESYRFPRI
jgi:hypothetical protein